jgi:hypothetical protein
MMQRDATRSWSSDLAWYLGLVGVTGVAFGIGAGPVAGLLAASGMLGFTVLLAIGRRRIDALRVVGGAGDERNQELYMRSLATAGGTLGLAVTGWFLVTVAAGEADGRLMILTVLFAGTFVGTAFVRASRG